MQSNAITVADYLKESPADRQDALAALRTLCLHQLKGYEEVMEYGSPCYKKNNIVEAGFASQKNFIAVYILKQAVLEKYRDQLEGKGISIGKGAIRFSKTDKINFDIIEKMLQDTFTSTNIVCG